MMFTFHSRIQQTIQLDQDRVIQTVQPDPIHSTEDDAHGISLRASEEVLRGVKQVLEHDCRFKVLILSKQQRLLGA